MKWIPLEETHTRILRNYWNIVALWVLFQSFYSFLVVALIIPSIYGSLYWLLASTINHGLAELAVFNSNIYLLIIQMVQLTSWCSLTLFFPCFQGSSTSEIRIYEVGPRDGLQNEAKFVPTDIKIELINKLAGAGLKDIESAR